MVDSRRGRPTGGGDARSRLLAAARRHLESGSLPAVSSRALAAEAGVSHSLVNFHFGGREGLLAAAASVSIAPHEVVVASMRADGSIDLRRLATSIIAVWEHPQHGAALTALAQDLAGGGARSTAIADYLERAVCGRLQDALGQERGRAATAAIVGTLFARYVIGVPSFTRMSPDEAARHLLLAIGGRP